MSIAEEVFKVRGERSRSWQDQMYFHNGGIHSDSVVSRLTCSVMFAAAVMAQRLLQVLGVWHGTQHEELQRI